MNKLEQLTQAGQVHCHRALKSDLQTSVHTAMPKDVCCRHQNLAYASAANTGGGSTKILTSIETIDTCNCRLQQ